MKKNKRIELAVAIILTILLGLAILWSLFLNQKIPSIDILFAKNVSLGEEFRLKKGEAAKLKDRNVTLKITEFIYSPCPANAECVWSGLAVKYELTVDGINYSKDTKTSYDVVETESDYKTYANFIIKHALSR